MNLGHHSLFHLFYFGTPLTTHKKLFLIPFIQVQGPLVFTQISLFWQCLQFFVGVAISIFVAETPLLLPSIASVCIKVITGSGHVGGNIHVAF